MAFTLWLSAEEEHILEKIMRVEGARNKEQAVIMAIRDKGASLAALPSLAEVDAPAHVLRTEAVGTTPVAVDVPAFTPPALADLDTRVAAL